MPQDIIQQIAARRPQYGLSDILALARMQQTGQPSTSEETSRLQYEQRVREWEAGKPKREADLLNAQLNVEEEKRAAQNEIAKNIAMQQIRGMETESPAELVHLVDKWKQEFTRTSEENETAILLNKVKQGEIPIDDVERDNPTAAMFIQKELGIPPLPERMARQGNEYVVSMGTPEAIWDLSTTLRRPVAIANKLEKEYDKAFELGIESFEGAKQYMRLQEQIDEIEEDKFGENYEYEILGADDEPTDGFEGWKEYKKLGAGNEAKIVWRKLKPNYQTAIRKFRGMQKEIRGMGAADAPQPSELPPPSGPQSSLEMIPAHESTLPAEIGQPAGPMWGEAKQQRLDELKRKRDMYVD